MKAYLKKITPLYQFYLNLLQRKRKLYEQLTIPAYKVKRQTIVSIANQFQCKDVFVETGTFMGETVAFLKNEFTKLYSIELNEVLADKAKKRFEADEKVEIVQGDSASQLQEILRGINTPVIFWLDGHYSSEFQVGSEYIVTGKGEKDTPIMEELNQIHKHHIKNHLILIDDARLFNGNNDYPTKEQVKNYVKEFFPNHKISIKNDMIRILPKQL